MGGRGQRPRALDRLVAAAARRGWVELSGDGAILTAVGQEMAASVVRKHRLWELYLTRRLELASDHVHRDAEAMEHVLSDDAVVLLWDRLGRPSVDPHGRSIPPPPAALEVR
jgi:manganese/zinc/iron transport system permease protein